MMIKPIINSFEDTSARKVCSLNIETPMLKNLKATVKNCDCGGHQFITEIKNAYDKVLGFESFSMHENDPSILGLYIQVEPEYRNRHHLGEILRLISIIELIENKARHLKIFSKNSAVYFHAKYKFMPDITQFKERDSVLKDIVANKTPFTKTEAIQASKILDDASITNSSETQRELCKQANDVINRYIKKVFSMGDKEYKKHPFSFGMNMMLTKKEILGNKDFFNELFAKHNIDYKI